MGPVRVHHQPVVDPPDARSTRRRVFGRLTLEPGAHGSRQQHDLAGDRDRDVTRIDVRVAMERFDNAVPDVDARTPVAAVAQTAPPTSPPVLDNPGFYLGEATRQVG